MNGYPTTDGRIEYKVMGRRGVLEIGTVEIQVRLNECDRLAAIPWDRNCIGVPVQEEDFQPNNAVEACSIAVRDNRWETDERVLNRFRVQLCRALYVSGSSNDAERQCDLPAQQNDPVALYYRGFILYNRAEQSISGGREIAIQLFRRAAELEFPPSQFMLGYILSESGTQEERAEATRWIEAALARTTGML